MYFSHKINVEKCAEILPNWENMDKVPLTSKENNICYICKENKLCGRRDQNCDISNCASKIVEVYKPGLNVVNMGNTIWMTKSRYLSFSQNPILFKLLHQEFESPSLFYKPFRDLVVDLKI